MDGGVSARVVDFLTGTPEGYLDTINDMIAQLEAIPADEDQRQAMVLSDLLAAVTGLKVLELTGMDAHWIDQLPGVWARVGEALAARPAALARYQAKMELAFWRGHQVDWFDGSLRRTALEILRNDVEPNSRPFLDDHDLNQIDAQLPDVAKRTAPLAPEWIPAGLPDNHWWWTIPSGDPDDDYEDY
jgi:hypothetical protein